MTRPLPDPIYALSRPHSSLLVLYVVRAILTGPLLVVTLPLLLFRYKTLQYRFDEQGIHMQWGLLFRREINLTYARIQDIHVRSGVIQRWLGLADLMVQTASGSAGPEMTIEGFREHRELRDFLYTRMRGVRGGQVESAAVVADGVAHASEELHALLRDIRDELRATRIALEHGRGAEDEP